MNGIHKDVYEKLKVIHATNVNVYAKAVYNALLDCADAEGRCFPSYAKLRKMTSIKTDTTISKAIKDLVKAGLIKKINTQEEGKRKSNNKYVLLPVRYQDVVLHNMENGSLCHVEGSTCHVEGSTGDVDKQIPLTKPLTSYCGGGSASAEKRPRDSHGRYANKKTESSIDMESIMEKIKAGWDTMTYEEKQQWEWNRQLNKLIEPAAAAYIS